MRKFVRSVKISKRPTRIKKKCLSGILKGDSRVCGYVLSEILSFINVHELSTKMSSINKLFNISTKSALICRKAFSHDEYLKILDINSGVGEDLLFQLCTSNGIDVRYKIPSEIGWHDVFCYACFKGYTKSVVNLLHRCRPTQDCLLFSCMEGHGEIFNLLLEDKRVLPNFDHNVLLRVAAKAGHDDLLKVLLSYDSVDPGEFDNQALKSCVRHRNIRCIETLLSCKRLEIDQILLNEILRLMPEISESGVKVEETKE